MYPKKRGRKISQTKIKTTKQKKIERKRDSNKRMEKMKAFLFLFPIIIIIILGNQKEQNNWQTNQIQYNMKF